MSTLKSFNFTFHSIAIPIICQSLLTVSMSVADVMLAIPLGKVVVSALVLVSTIIVAITAVQLGIAQAILIWTLKNNHRAKQFAYLYYGGTLSFVLSLAITTLLSLFSKELFALLTNDHSIATLAITYSTYMAYVLPITAITTSIGFYLRAKGRTFITLQGFAIEMPINIAISYWLIYMHQIEAPIAGLAIGSLVGRFVRLVWMCSSFVVIDRKSFFVQLSLSKRLPKEELFAYLRVAASLASTSLGLGTAGIALTSLYSRFPLSEFGVFSMLLPIQSIVLTVANAVASTTSVLFKKSSETIEKSSIEGLCHSISINYLFCTVAITYTLGVCYVIYFKAVETIALLTIYTSLSIVQSLLRGYASLYANGYLKLAGKHLFCLYTELLPQWLLLIPTVYLMNSVFHLPLSTVLLLAIVIDVVCVGLLRWKLILHFRRNCKVSLSRKNVEQQHLS